MPGNLLEQDISGACAFFISASALSSFLSLDDLYIRHVVFSDREQFCDKNKFPFNLCFEDNFLMGYDVVLIPNCTSSHSCRQSS
jgi:hypothetical protein